MEVNISAFIATALSIPIPTASPPTPYVQTASQNNQISGKKNNFF